MKEIPITAFRSFDGRVFLDKDECERHEEENFAGRFVGLTLEQVVGAIERTDPDLSLAFERLGARIGQKRRVEDKEFLRRPKQQELPPVVEDGADEPEESEAPQEPAEAFA